MNPESALWRRLFPLACGACAIVFSPAYGDILYTIPTFATGPGAAGKSYDPALVSVLNHSGVSGTTGAQLLTLQTLNPAAATSTTSPHFQNNVTVDATQTPGTLLTDVGVSNVSYFQFGAAADPGALIFPTDLTFDVRRATDVAGTDRLYSVQASVNGGNFTTIASQVPVTAVRGAAATTVTLPLTDQAFQGGVKIDFRIMTLGGGALEFTKIKLNGTLDVPGFGSPFVDQTSVVVTPNGITIVLTDWSGAVVNPVGITAALTTGGTPVPTTSVTSTKTGNVTTIKIVAPIAPNTGYDYELTVPRSDVATPDDLVNQAPVVSYKLPLNLAGLAGTVGTWGIREYQVGAGGNQAALDAIAGNPAFVEASSAVFNRRDPDTNAGDYGQFNPKSPIISDTPADDSFIVVGKTKVTVPAAGDYTFAVHSDDGFAMRVTGGRFTSYASGGGNSGIDPADPQTLFYEGGASDSNMHGVYHFDAAGTYDITYLGYDGGGGAYYEVAWAPGAFTADLQTDGWTLVGTPGDPSVPAAVNRMPVNLPGPASTDAKWSIRTYLAAKNGTNNVDSLTATNTFLSTTTRQPTDADGLTIDVQRQVLNANDPEAPGDLGSAPPAQAFPGNKTGVDDNNVVTVAKSRIKLTSAGTYTFQNRGDDGFLLRIKGVGATPTPNFRKVTGNGTRDIRQANEWYNNTNGATRAIVDLQAGSYDLEYVQYENTGGFYYELTAAAGEWPTDTPTNGWQLVGDTTGYGSVVLPKIASPGWTVETSVPGLKVINNTIADAEASITQTEALNPVPGGTITTWNSLDFTDPELGAEGSFSPSHPFPLNTSGQDFNYAMRATGKLVVTVAGEYQLGYQGDDGGYMIINADPSNTPALTPPAFKSIVFTNHPTIAKLTEEVTGSGRKNMMVTETATPNSRTIGTVNLEVGIYTIKTLFFQGGGNSWWEVFGAQTPAAPGFVLPLLTTDGPTTTGALPTGLPLVAQVVTPVTTPFNITNFATTGNPATGVSFTFASANSGTYAVQVSTDLVNWSTLTASVTDNGNGTSGVTASFASQTVGGQPIAGQPKLFVRVVRTF